MSKNRKELKFKYKFRRALLIFIGCALLIGMGWLLGNNPWKQEKNPPPEEQEDAPEATLGASGGVVQEPIKAPEVAVKTPPNGYDWENFAINSTTPATEAEEVPLTRVSGEISVDSRIADPLKQMIAVARADGFTLELSGGYQSFEEQEELYKDAVSVLVDTGKSEEEAKRLLEGSSFPPGSNEYHTGLVVDILAPDATKENLSFSETSAFTWLEEHAHEYGFILRYPKGKEDMTHRDFEPWHFRYVGVEVATEIWENGYCFEEYLFVKKKSNSKAEKVEKYAKEKIIDTTPPEPAPAS